MGHKVVKKIKMQINQKLNYENNHFSRLVGPHGSVRNLGRVIYRSMFTYLAKKSSFGTNSLKGTLPKSSLNFSNGVKTIDPLNAYGIGLSVVDVRNCYVKKAELALDRKIALTDLTNPKKTIFLTRSNNSDNHFIDSEVLVGNEKSPQYSIRPVDLTQNNLDVRLVGVNKIIGLTIKGPSNKQHRALLNAESQQIFEKIKSRPHILKNIYDVFSEDSLYLTELFHIK